MTEIKQKLLDMLPKLTKKQQQQVEQFADLVGEIISHNESLQIACVNLQLKNQDLQRELEGRN